MRKKSEKRRSGLKTWKIWLLIWAICYAGMLFFSISELQPFIEWKTPLQVSIWYIGIGLPLIYLEKKYEEEENEQGKRTL